MRWSAFKEKKATSEPAKTADRNNRATKMKEINPIELRLMEGSKASNNRLGKGSGSIKGVNLSMQIYKKGNTKSDIPFFVSKI